MKGTSSQEEIKNQVQQLLEDRGRKALEMARKCVLEEEIESKDVSDALRYFMTQYWHDVARPALLSIGCEAVGGDPNLTIQIAIPLTLISGGVDIHDDIIDQSEVKGSRPTVLGKFGKDIALLVGDALLFKGLTLLHQAVEKGIPDEKILPISDIIKKMFFELGEAEALELQFRGKLDITIDEYLSVVRKKAADVEAHMHISAILGEGTKEEIEALSMYGRILGMLIILRDELIDMIDLEETMHRIKKEHLPLPFIYALQNSKIKNETSSVMLKETITKRDAEKLLASVKNEGGFDRVEKLMQELAKESYKHIQKIKCNRHQLLIMIKRIILPEWRNFLGPPKPDR